jgi:hypothetical protein
MITLAQRVYHAIDSFERGEYEFALEDAAVAIDITAQRHFQKEKSSKSDYKSLLDEYFWLIELMALNGIDLQNSFFQNVSIPGVVKPRMPDIIYHMVRCGLVHSTGLPKSLVFVPGRVASFAHNFISLPAQTLWGLLSIAVFAKANADEVSDGDYFLSYESQQFSIKSYWGKEDLIRPIYDKEVETRVAMEMTPFLDK